MTKRKFKKLTYADFGSPAFVGRIMLGHEDRETKDIVVTEQNVEQAGDFISSEMYGVTVTPARGRYRYTSGPRAGMMANEPTTVFDVLGMQGQDYPTCKKFKEKLDRVAYKLARDWNQETAAVTVWCNDGTVDVDFVGPKYELQTSARAGRKALSGLRSQSRRQRRTRRR